MYDYLLYLFMVNVLFLRVYIEGRNKWEVFLLSLPLSFVLYAWIKIKHIPPEDVEKALLYQGNGYLLVWR